ncbi:unnamed protein product [Schistocephalus solidus]|uniref:LITAF domain-containing protein n=1 Tax=Schistocephalus solidus TaxID=70667 RepID=A0A183TGI6_SCHSO|nr:unnamed protein product [Schistocephalus solidus]
MLETFANFPSLFYILGAPTTVIVQQPVAFGPAPMDIQCPYCQAHVRTGLAYESGTLTWLAAALICILGYAGESASASSYRSALIPARMCVTNAPTATAPWDAFIGCETS